MARRAVMRATMCCGHRISMLQMAVTPVPAACHPADGRKRMCAWVVSAGEHHIVSISRGHWQPSYLPNIACKGARLE